MALVNYATREINAKIVYYGPGLSGKTTNIQYVFEKVKPGNKGKLISLSTQGDRTLFFDFLPVELGSIKGFKTRFHLYTVPGQVFYNSTRKLVLKGADGVVFVADSQAMMMDENIQSMENLKGNLADMGIKPESFPIIIQYNKRDLPNAAPVEEMNQYLNPTGLPYFQASAIVGEGVLMTLTAIVKFILHHLKQDPDGHNIDFEALEEKEPVVPVPAEETTEPEVALQPPAPVMENTVMETAVEAVPEEITAPIQLEEQLLEAAEVERLAEAITEVEAEAEPEAAPEPVPAPDAEVVPEAEPESVPAGPPAYDILDGIPRSPEEEALFTELAKAEAEPRPGPRVRETFNLPVRITTGEGLKEVVLKVHVDIELDGDGMDSVSKVEVLQPVQKGEPKPSGGSADESKLKPPEPERPKQAPALIPKPKIHEKKVSMFHKILGMR